MPAQPAPRVAFVAPLKPAGHGVPSGDREMARLLVRAIELAGYQPELDSSLSSFDGAGSPAVQSMLRNSAAREIDRLVGLYGGRPAEARPALWFTYHVYYKAPDLIGPAVADALGLPYVVAEGSHAPKRANGHWAGFHADAQRALTRADVHLVLNPGDRPMLEAIRRPGQRFIDLPPFLDPADWPDAAERSGEGSPVRLLCVAMMRDGDKLASYRALAKALALVPETWTLDIVGDGPMRQAVADLFQTWGNRVRFRGMVSGRSELGRLYAAADLMVWPAVNEAFGMVFLEAALHGCPALAGSYGGVGGVVADGVTGVLAAPGDTVGFAAALSRLLAEPALRQRLSNQARSYVLARHSIGGAARTLRAALEPLNRHREHRP